MDICSMRWMDLLSCLYKKKRIKQIKIQLHCVKRLVLNSKLHLLFIKLVLLIHVADKITFFKLLIATSFKSFILRKMGIIKKEIRFVLLIFKLKLRIFISLKIFRFEGTQLPVLQNCIQFLERNLYPKLFSLWTF